MKTADLIPFILLELNAGDKYGFELTKEIETKSNGKIIIKQPTLYTLLKKLEKSKFISSYWQDSEIGGKRHYYKLTENGKLQVSTLPTYSFLLEKAMNTEFDTAEECNADEQPVPQQNPTSEKRLSIMDELLNINQQPEETILPTKEIFAENKIDNSTDWDINLSNTEVLKDEKVSHEENFASSTVVSRFTEKSTPAPVENVELKNKNTDFLDKEFIAPKNEMNVSFVNYVNFKNTDNYKYSKSLAKNMLYRTLVTSASLIVMLVLCSIITNYTGTSTFYHVFFISSLITAIFTPVIYALNMEKFRLKHQKITYHNNTKKLLLVAFIVVLAIFMVSIIVNICMGNNSIGKLFSLKNFENLYAPLLIVSTLFLDMMYSHLFISKIQK